MSMPFARPVPSYAIPSSERPRHFIPPLEPSQTDPDSRHQAVTPVHAVCAAHGLIGFREPGYEWRRGPVDPSLPAIRPRIYSSNCDSPQESDDVERLLPCTFQNAHARYICASGRSTPLHASLSQREPLFIAPRA
jgi:hypothetical protein